MELQQVFETISKRLESFNEIIHFEPQRESGVKSTEISVFSEDDLQYIRFSGAHGSYKINLNKETNILTLDCSAESTDQAEYKEMLKCLFDWNHAEERAIKSLVNELVEELTPLYKEQKKELSGVKLPKGVSKSAVKNGMVSYTEMDLTTRFVDQYSELKDAAKELVLKYDELLPETFFVEYGTPMVINMLRSKDETQLKKLFKLLNDVFENGTNAAQDVIAVTILGEMHNDPAMIETADIYMCDYMAGPVHEVNKLISKNSLQKKLKNPPPYKPKKKKKGVMSTLMTGGGQPPQ